jgi:hypothetical protein
MNVPVGKDGRLRNIRFQFRYAKFLFVCGSLTYKVNDAGERFSFYFGFSLAAVFIAVHLF